MIKIIQKSIIYFILRGIGETSENISVSLSSK